MSQERLSMRKIKEVLRLKQEIGLSNRVIAGACKISNSTVGEYIRRAEAVGLGWPLPEISEEDIYKKLFPDQKEKPGKNRPIPDWEEIKKELRQKGVTLRLLWMEYIERYPDGYRYSRFCEQYENWKKMQAEPVKRNIHVGGKEMQVDYAGTKVTIVNPETGEKSQASIFVASLPASNYTYAEAQASQSQCNWNNGHVRAFEYYGGVVQIVKPDNAKTGVTRPNYYEPDINPSYQELAEHYQFAVIPARIRKPKDKAKVENSVQNVERWIIAPLRKRTFFSLFELNQAIWELLEILNNKKMQLIGRSRREEFEEIDQPNLKPLPARPYEFVETKKAKVNIDYHIVFDKHFYSVPFTLCHQEVEVRATEFLVEIRFQGKNVAVHTRSFRQGRFTTLAEHMPANHRFEEKINAEQLVRWAAKIGPFTASMVQATLQSRRFPEQAFRSCLGMISLAKKHNFRIMEQASQNICEAKVFSYQALKHELASLSKTGTNTELETLPPHENIRGNQYYQ